MKLYPKSYYIIGGAVLFFIEIIIKQLMLQKQPRGNDAIFSLDFYANSHISYGIELGPFWLMMGILICIFIWLIWSWFVAYTKKEVGIVIGLTLMITGAFNNIMDRLIHGFVIDYISFWPQSWFGIFPIFNLADTFIFIGFCVICVAFLRHQKTSTQGRG